MSKKVWLFAIQNPCMLSVADGIEEPAYREGGKYYRAKQHPPIVVTFNQYSGTATVRDEATAEALKGLDRFRTEANPDGDIWLVKEMVLSDAPSIPKMAPAPKRKKGPTVQSGARGTSTRVKTSKNVRKPVMVAKPKVVVADE